MEGAMSCMRCDCCRDSQSKAWDRVEGLAAENAASAAWEAAEIAEQPLRVLALMVARAQINAARRAEQRKVRLARRARGQRAFATQVWRDCYRNYTYGCGCWACADTGMHTC